MEHKKDLGKLFKERLADTETAPEKSLWPDIEKTLDRKRKKRFYGIWLSSLLEVFLAGLILILFFTEEPVQKTENNALQPVIENTDANLNLKKVESTHQNSDLKTDTDSTLDTVDVGAKKKSLSTKLKRPKKNRAVLKTSGDERQKSKDSTVPIELLETLVRDGTENSAENTEITRTEGGIENVVINRDESKIENTRTANEIPDSQTTSDISEKNQTDIQTKAENILEQSPWMGNSESSNTAEPDLNAGSNTLDYQDSRKTDSTLKNLRKKTDSKKRESYVKDPRKNPSSQIANSDGTKKGPKELIGINAQRPK
ncbi:MAG: hypothetical protein WBG48_12030, partial [Pricia sp.]